MPEFAARIDRALAPARAGVPPGYRIEAGSDKEQSTKDQGSTFRLMPQLQSFSKLALVILTAPLGMIGVSLFLLAFNWLFGFVPLLGTIALAVMIKRTSVIPVDKIDQDIEAGHTP